MDRRNRQYVKLISEIEAAKYRDCKRSCFKLLYNLSTQLHYELVSLKTYKYLTIFENRFPTIEWTRKILNAPGDYVSKHGRKIPECPEATNIADEEFLFCFHAIVLAFEYVDHNSIVSTSLVCALAASIRALSLNTWIEQSPLEYNAFVKANEDDKMNILDNDILHAAKKQEWQEAASWFKQKGILDLPNGVDEKKMERVLKYWEGGELSLIVPTTRKLLEKGRKNLEINIFDIL